MNLRVLQLIAQQTLPCNLKGHDAMVVESMVAGGWVKATVAPDALISEGFKATAHEIKPFGRRQLETYR